MLLTLKFPTELAVKTHANGQVVSLTLTTPPTAIAAVQAADVDAIEAAANAAIVLKEDALINLLMLLS